MKWLFLTRTSLWTGSPARTSIGSGTRSWKSGEITYTAAANACGLPLSAFRDKAAVCE